MGQMLSEVWGHVGDSLGFRGKARTSVGQVLTSGGDSQWPEGASGSALHSLQWKLAS